MDTRTLPAVRRVRHGQQRHKCGPPPAIHSAACSRRYHCSNSHRRFASAQVGIARHDDAGFAATATDLAVLCVVVPPQPVPRSQKHVAALSWGGGRAAKPLALPVRWRCCQRRGPAADLGWERASRSSELDAPGTRRRRHGSAAVPAPARIRACSRPRTRPQLSILTLCVVLPSSADLRVAGVSS
jgi:hypothetical protein